MVSVSQFQVLYYTEIISFLELLFRLCGFVVSYIEVGWFQLSLARGEIKVPSLLRIFSYRGGGNEETLGGQQHDGEAIGLVGHTMPETIAT